MSAVTGIIRRRAEAPLWDWSGSQIELEADQAVFFLRKRDRSLVRVEVSGADPAAASFEPGCDGLVVNRDFGVRLRLPCEFAGRVPGEIDAEVRLRLLDHASEWPRRLPQSAAIPTGSEGASPEQALGQLIASLFEREIAGFASGWTYAEISSRLNDPLLIAEAEDRVRRALARWTEEGILSLLALHLLGVTSPEGERQRHTVLERKRLEEEHGTKLLSARQASELAEVEHQRALAAPEEVRWRLFGPTDLLPANARPPALVKESAAPFEALTSGQHLQLLIRPVTEAYVYILALGPYHAGGRTEYRWMRLLGKGGRSDLKERVPRADGNRLAAGEALLFPGDIGAAELFQHYLTVDAAPGWESLLVALTLQEIPEAAFEAGLPKPSGNQADFRAFQNELNRGLQSRFGTDARLYLFQFFHS